MSQNTALFSLLGTVYGGDGKSTFALPDLQGRTPLHPGQGQGLSDRFLGEESGSDYVTLLTSEIPVHTHSLNASNGFGNSTDPTAKVLSRVFGGGNMFKTGTTPTDALAAQALAPAGGDQPHNNLMPYLTVNFCIAMQGIYPARP